LHNRGAGESAVHVREMNEKYVRNMADHKSVDTQMVVTFAE